jgi:hypothetical protein
LYVEGWPAGGSAPSSISEPEDAKAIRAVAHQAPIPGLVNYETTWYRSNHTAYDLVRSGALEEVLKILVHDWH